MHTWFARLATRISGLTGSALAFAVATLIVLIWAVTGPLFRFSDTWQLVINTGTTIVTFLMVFLIQNTQNRDTEALQLKLDELIRSNRHARNRLLDLEDLDEDELDRVKAGFKKLAKRHPEAAEHLDDAREDLEQAASRIEETGSSRR